jgi:hypothetical protein
MAVAGKTKATIKQAELAALQQEVLLLTRNRDSLLQELQNTRMHTRLVEANLAALDEKRTVDEFISVVEGSLLPDFALLSCAMPAKPNGRGVFVIAIPMHQLRAIVAVLKEKCKPASP